MRIALAAGDGIGPEIMQATLDLFRAAGVEKHLEFTPVEMGRALFDRGFTRGMSDEAVRTVEECGVLFKGPMETPKGGGGKSINVTARKMWSAFANVRHFRTLPGVQAAGHRAGANIDFTIDLRPALAAAALRECAAPEPRPALAVAQVHRRAALGAGEFRDKRRRGGEFQPALAVHIHDEVGVAVLAGEEIAEPAGAQDRSSRGRGAGCRRGLPA